MKNGLIVKEIDFLGDSLIAARHSNGIIWASVRALCEGMGLTKDQARNERRKIQEDLILSKGESNLTRPTNCGLPGGCRHKSRDRTAAHGCPRHG